MGVRQQFQPRERLMTKASPALQKIGGADVGLWRILLQSRRGKTAEQRCATIECRR
jgi:hypothetical protein